MLQLISNISNLSISCILKKCKFPIICLLNNSILVQLTYICLASLTWDIECIVQMSLGVWDNAIIPASSAASIWPASSYPKQSLPITELKWKYWTYTTFSSSKHAPRFFCAEAVLLTSSTSNLLAVLSSQATRLCGHFYSLLTQM